MANINQENLHYYENIEFTLDNGASEYDLDAQQATFLTRFGVGNVVGDYPTYVSIRTSQTISVKLNSTSSHAITIASTDSPFVIPSVNIRNIYLSNSSGQNSAVKILLLKTPY